MKTQTDRSRYFQRGGTARGILTPLITGIAVILFSTAGFARIVGWGPNSAGASGDGLAPDQMPAVRTMSEARADARCAECGMFVSMREVESEEDTGAGAAGGATTGSRDETRVKTTRRYEITIRMADGSARVIGDANPARWRAGERLIVIGGANPSHP
jgi:outer membrane lipoprotein SlyB